MNQFSATMPNLADMAEASRLTRAGRFQEAAALIQRSLSGQPAPGTAPRSGSQPRTIDLVAAQVASQRPASAAEGEGAHAALLPEAMRGLVDGVKRGLAPVVKGLIGKDFPGGDSAGKGLFGRSPRPGDETFVERSFSNASGSRDYKLFVPTNRSGKLTGSRPLVVMLHGCTQSPDDFAAGTRMNALAEGEGIYVAYPRQTRGANMQKCWNWFETKDQGREHGEAGIIAGIARAVMAEHDIDPSRVYIAGLSAGGAAAANVARAYPDLFAAVGVHSGLAAGCARDLSSALMAMRNGAPGGTEPGGAAGFGAGPATEAVRVPTIVFHGQADTTVNPANGEAVLAQAGSEGLKAEREEDRGRGHAYTRTRYRDADGRVQIESWLVKGAGHAWSGGSAEGSYTDPQGPDASRAMLDFFAGHALGHSLRR